jgi:hypothetical protein
METGLQGQLQKSQLPYSMGDLYKLEADGRAWFKDSDMVALTYLTSEAAAAAVLPSEFSLPRTPVEGLALAMLTFWKSRSGTLEPFSEVNLQIPCLYQVCWLHGTSVQKASPLDRLTQPTCKET